MCDWMLMPKELGCCSYLVADCKNFTVAATFEIGTYCSLYEFWILAIFLFVSVSNFQMFSSDGMKCMYMAYQKRENTKQ